MQRMRSSLAEAAGLIRARTMHSRRRGFSLVELLTVMFIIGLLVGLLIPSLNRARNLAKKTATASTFQSIRVGLDLFKNENEKDFLRTNGYPPSFAHPPIPESPFTAMESEKGQFPFSIPAISNMPPFPVVTGAHWLPAMLMGADQKGYIARASVPKTNQIHQKPWTWYADPPIGPDTPLDRRNLYLDPNTRTIVTEKLIGKRNPALFPDWDKMKALPVIVDSFDQPVLYYAANAQGRQTNMVEEKRDPTNSYSGGPQKDGPPYYFHQDNHSFTGDEMTEEGWDFGGGTDPGNNQVHEIQYSGHAYTAADNEISKQIDTSLRFGDTDYLQPTFAKFILDRKLRQEFEEKEIVDMNAPIDKATPLRPVNDKSYLLISAGVDGRYGTTDDVANFPLSTE